MNSLQTIREVEIDDVVGFSSLINHLKMSDLDGKWLEEDLVFVDSVELIGDEREMRVELMICCVLEERSKEGDDKIE